MKTNFSPRTGFVPCRSFTRHILTSFAPAARCIAPNMRRANRTPGSSTAKPAKGWAPAIKRAGAHWSSATWRTWRAIEANRTPCLCSFAGAVAQTGRRITLQPYNGIETDDLQFRIFDVAAGRVRPNARRQRFRDRRAAVHEFSGHDLRLEYARQNHQNRTGMENRVDTGAIPRAPQEGNRACFHRGILEPSRTGPLLLRRLRSGAVQFRAQV